MIVSISRPLFINDALKNKSERNEVNPMDIIRIALYSNCSSIITENVRHNMKHLLV